MIYLADTNILLRLADRRDPKHSIVREALRKLRRDGHALRITSQNCIEFWNVVTRPAAKNGLGLTPTEADRLIGLVERLFPLLPESPAIYPEWRRLVATFGISGVQVHDARLVAVMNTNDISHILTFNTTDFKRYSKEGIVAQDPITV